MTKSSSPLCAEVLFVPNIPAKRASFIQVRPWLLLFMTIVLCFSPFARGQELEGSLSGTVTDANGAAIPNAAITITLNGSNGVARTVQTNNAGEYIATNLPPGTYTIVIAASSFDKFSAQDVVLNVAQKRTVNAQLKVGSEGQTVTVEANSVALETESGGQAGTISGTQVRELELNNRNFQSLVALQPGVVNLLGDQPGFGSLNSVSTISVNGARTGANNWSVDGADINDSGSNTTLLNIPSVDAIQEFTMERSSYDASFGRSGGGQILVATRSGNSTFHGDVYEFVRTENTNANTYFNNLNGDPRQPDHYNNFGFTLGGPLYIPRVYNESKQKTFFFWSEEWRKVTVPTSQNIPAPTTAELAGAFFSEAPLVAPAGCITSYTPYNPQTGAGGNGTIAVGTPGCVSKNSQVYLTQVFSKFTANSGGDIYQPYSELANFRQDLVRIDHYFNDKLRFFARGMEDEAPSNAPTGLWGGANYVGVANVGINAPGYNVVANLTWTISPKMVNEVEFAYSQGGINATLSGPANSHAVLSSLTNNLANPDPYGRIPSVTILDGSVTGVSQGSAPYNERNLDRNIFDNFTVTIAKHTLHAGFTAQQMLKTENAGEGNPNFYFNTWGDFLLGNASEYTQASRDIVPDLRFWNTEAFLQDDWKATHRLTVNLGLRWTRFPSPSDVKNTLTNFDSAVYQAKNAPALDADGNFVAGQAYTPATYANGLIFPTGAACTQAQAVSGQVTCSPFGNLVNPNNNWNFAPRVGFAYSLFGNGTTVVRGGFGIFFDRTLDGIWEQNAFSDPPLVQTTTVNNTSFDSPLLVAAAAPPLAPNGLTTTGTPTFKVPSYADYNLSAQQQLGRGTIFELAYVGSQSRHMLGELDLNMPTLATRAANPNSALNNIRPYLGYSYFHTRLPIFTANYNSMQVSVNHKTRDLTVGAAFTWSKNMTDQYSDRGTANTYSYNPRLDYGASGLNEPRIFVGSVIYKEPFFREQHGLIGHTLGGWETSGIFNFASGLSTNVYQHTDPFGCVADTTTANGCAPGTYPGGLGIQSANYDIFARPDQVAAISLPKTRTQWFSTSSFAAAQGHFGSSRAGDFLSPGMERIDLALMRNFKFGERANLQLRAEAFNLFNHTNFGNTGLGTLSGIDTGLGDPNFGQAIATFEPRTMQFSGKLYF